MSDECRFAFDAATREILCVEHSDDDRTLPPSLCTHAAAALLANKKVADDLIRKVAEALPTPVGRGYGLDILNGIRDLKARVLEVEGQVTQTVEERESTVGELDALLREAREERDRAEATVGRLIDWQAEATRLAAQVENLEHELGQVNERLRRIVG